MREWLLVSTVSSKMCLSIGLTQTDKMQILCYNAMFLGSLLHLPWLGTGEMMWLTLAMCFRMVPCWCKISRREILLPWLELSITEATNTIGEPGFSATIRSRDITVYYACKEFTSKIIIVIIIFSLRSFRWLRASWGRAYLYTNCTSYFWIWHRHSSWVQGWGLTAPSRHCVVSRRFCNTFSWEPGRLPVYLQCTGHNIAPVFRAGKWL